MTRLAFAPRLAGPGSAGAAVSAGMATVVARRIEPSVNRWFTAPR